LLYTDPSGHLGKFWKKVITIGVGILVTAAVVALTVATCGTAGAALLGAMAGGLISGGVGAALEGGDWFDIGFAAMTGMMIGAVTAGILGGIGSLVAPQFLGNGVGIIANGKNFIPAMYSTFADVANRIFGTASTNLINGIGNGMLAGSASAGAIGGSAGSSYATALAKNSTGGNGDLVETIYSSSANGGGDIQQMLDYYGLEINLASSGGGNGTVYVQNNSEYTIYFKPESEMVVNGVTYKDGGAYPLEPGGKWHYPVDGVKTHLHSDQVFKVPGKFGLYGDVTIDINGKVDLDFYGAGPILSRVHGGWHTSTELPAANFKALFESVPFKP
jgi:hypothetical protein